MKYIGKYFNAERLLTYYRNCERLAKITINLCCQKRIDLCGCNSVLVYFSLHHQMSITIVRSRCVVLRDCRGCDRIVVVFITTYATSAYHPTADHALITLHLSPIGQLADKSSLR